MFSRSEFYCYLFTLQYQRQPPSPGYRSRPSLGVYTSSSNRQTRPNISSPIPADHARPATNNHRTTPLSFSPAFTFRARSRIMAHGFCLDQISPAAGMIRPMILGPQTPHRTVARPRSRRGATLLQLSQKKQEILHSRIILYTQQPSGWRAPSLRRFLVLLASAGKVIREVQVGSGLLGLRVSLRYCLGKICLSFAYLLFLIVHGRENLSSSYSVSLFLDDCSRGGALISGMV